MGRKVLPKEQLKTRQINFWLTEIEYQNLLLQSDASGMHLNNWLRKYLFSKKLPPVKMSPDLRNAIIELNKIGVNLNQLTHLANASKQFPSGLAQNISEVEKQLQDLKRRILDDSKTN